MLIYFTSCNFLKITLTQDCSSKTVTVPLKSIRIVTSLLSVIIKIDIAINHSIGMKSNKTTPPSGRAWRTNEASPLTLY